MKTLKIKQIKKYVLLFTLLNLTFGITVQQSLTTSADKNQQTRQVYSELSDGVSKFLGTANIHTWVDVRNQKTGNQKYDDWPNYHKGILASYSSKAGEIYVISRSYFSFNTSFLKQEDVIENASLNIYGYAINESSVCVVEWKDGTDGVDIDDYGLIGTINLGTSNGWQIDTYNEIPLNTHGIDYITKEGYTYLACREYNHDFLNITPKRDPFAEYRNGHYFSDEPGINKDPYLSITYLSKDQTTESEEQNDTPFISFLSLIFLLILFIYLMQKKKK